MSAPRAVVVGHVTVDRTAAGPRPGGSAWYGARALAALGARVRVLTAAGPEFPREALVAAGAGRRATPAVRPTTSTSTSTSTTTSGSIETIFVPTRVTTTFENVYAADGRRSQRVHGVAAALAAGALPPDWREAELLLLAPVAGELAPADFTAAVRTRVTGLCVQGLVRAVLPGGAVVPRRLDPGAGALAGVGLAVLGEDEAAGQPDLPAALARAVPLVVFTHGCRGCELLSAAGPRRVGVFPAREVDPTGAGDVFAAAMLLALARGDDPVAAARLGAAAASIVVEGEGGATLARVSEAWGRAAQVPSE